MIEESNDCSELFDRHTSQLENLHQIQSDYQAEPSADNCKKYRAALADYLDLLRNYHDCWNQWIPGVDSDEYLQAWERTRAELLSEPCE